MRFIIMIKRALLTGLLYLAMVFTFFYLLACFVQWELIVIPPINEWDNEKRLALFGTYFCLFFVGLMVEWEIADKRKAQEEREAANLASNLSDKGF